MQLWRNAKVRFLAKILLAAILMIWLVWSGKLDVQSFAFFFSEPSYLLASLGIFTLAALVLGATRFKILLGIFGRPLTFRKALSYQGIGLFANMFMPSAVGGDVVKAMYIKSDFRATKISHLVMAVFVDRLIGMYALFVIGSLAVLANLKLAASHGVLQTFAIVEVGGVLLVPVGLAVLFVLRRNAWLRDKLQKIAERWAFAKNLPELAATLLAHPKVMLAALLLSMASQIGLLLLFQLTFSLLNKTEVAFSLIAMLFPIGSLAVTLPLTPGGLGVGHLAYEKLFQLVHIADGANVFNVFVLAQIFLNIFMVIFYLGHRPIEPETVMAEEE